MESTTLGPTRRTINTKRFDGGITFSRQTAKGKRHKSNKVFAVVEINAVSDLVW